MEFWKRLVFQLQSVKQRLDHPIITSDETYNSMQPIMTEERLDEQHKVNGGRSTIHSLVSLYNDMASPAFSRPNLFIIKFTRQQLGKQSYRTKAVLNTSSAKQAKQHHRERKLCTQIYRTTVFKQNMVMMLWARARIERVRLTSLLELLRRMPMIMVVRPGP